MNRTEKTHFGYAQETHRQIEADTPALIPEAWHDIWREADHRAEKKVKVTLMLDTDVVQFFRAMGAGYGPRINRVLRAFMHDRLAGLVRGPEHSKDAGQLRALRQQAEALSAAIEAGLTEPAVRPPDKKE